MTKKKSKKVILINQNKGGVGKSFLAALVLGKETLNKSNFLMVDVDGGNQSTQKRFEQNEEIAPRIRAYSIIEDDTVQQTAFNTLFEGLAGSDADKIYLDLGGTESREILAFIRLVGIESVIEFFDENNLDVEFWTVINKSDSATTNHLNKVIQTLENKLPVVVYVNGQESQNLEGALIGKYREMGLDIRLFGAIKDARARQIISDHVITGFATKLGMLKGLWAKLINDSGI